MPIAKVFLAGLEKRAYKLKITKELERGIDISELHFSGTVFPKQNDKVLVLLDAADLANLQGIYHYQNHVKDESGYGRDGTPTDITFGQGPLGSDSSAVFNGSTSKILLANNPGFTLAGQFEIIFYFKGKAVNRNKAIKFNGSTQYAHAADNTIYDIGTQDFWMAGMFKRTTDSGTNDTILMKRASVSSINAVVGYYAIVDSQDQFAALLCDGSANGKIVRITTHPISLNVWYAWGASFDRSGNLTIYLYNISTGTLYTNTVDISTQQLTLTNTETFTVARAAFASQLFWFGHMDNLIPRHTGQTLTEAEFLEFAKTGRITGKTIANRYDFDGDGTDSIGSNDLTLVGSPTFVPSIADLVFFFSKRTANANGLAAHISPTTGKMIIYAGGSFIASDAALDDDSWHSCRIYRDASNVLKMDIDKVTQVSTATVAGSLEVDTPFIKGQDFDGSGVLDGRLAHFRIYTGGVLKTAEAKNIFKLKHHTSTIKFGGHIWKIDDSVTPRICHAKSFGKQIGETTVVQKVYNNQTVDFMVQDLIQTNTALTFVKGPSTQVSPAIVQFVAKGYLIDLVKTLAGQANKTFFTDGLAQFHWDDNDATQIPITYTHGAGAIIIDSGKDDTQLVNKVTVKGQDVLYQTREQFTGDGVTTVFTTSFIITNPLVTVDGLVKTAEQDYTINTQNKTLTFLAAPANAAAIVVQYTYDSPITIQSIDQDSIDKNGLRAKEVPAPWITTIGDATRFGQFYVQAFKDVKQRVTAKIPGIDVQVDSNQIVALVNSIKNINGAFTIKSVSWEYPGITTLDCGEFTFEQFELHKQVVSALHSLQALMSINTQIINFKNLRETLGITDTVTRKLLQRGKYNSNTFYSNAQVYR